MVNGVHHLCPGSPSLALLLLQTNQRSGSQAFYNVSLQQEEE